MAVSAWTYLLDGIRDDAHAARNVARKEHANVIPGTAATAAPIDSALAERIRDGDAQAFHELFVACWTPLVQYALRQLHAPDVAADVVQDVFVQLWARRHTLEVQGSLRGYLYGAVRHHAAHVRAHEQVVSRVEERLSGTTSPGMGTPPVPGDEAIVDAEQRIALRKAIHALPPRAREIMLLRWYDGLSYQEIANVLEISPATVNVQLTRALKSLRESLGGL